MISSAFFAGRGRAASALESFLAVAHRSHGLTLAASSGLLGEAIASWSSKGGHSPLTRDSFPSCRVFPLCRIKMLGLVQTFAVFFLFARVVGGALSAVFLTPVAHGLR